MLVRQTNSDPLRAPANKHSIYPIELTGSSARRLPSAAGQHGTFQHVTHQIKGTLPPTPDTPAAKGTVDYRWLHGQSLHPPSHSAASSDKAA